MKRVNQTISLLQVFKFIWEVHLAVAISVAISLYSYIPHTFQPVLLYYLLSFHIQGSLQKAFTLQPYSGYINKEGNRSNCRQLTTHSRADNINDERYRLYDMNKTPRTV